MAIFTTAMQFPVFVFRQIRLTFYNQGLLESRSNKVCSKKITQGPVDPDQHFNRDHDRDNYFSRKVRLKKFRTNPVIFTLPNSGPVFCTHATPPPPKYQYPLTMTT